MLGRTKNSGGGVSRQDMLVSEPNDAVEVEGGGLDSRVILDVELPFKAYSGLASSMKLSYTGLKKGDLAEILS